MYTQLLANKALGSESETTFCNRLGANIQVSQGTTAMVASITGHKRVMRRIRYRPYPKDPVRSTMFSTERVARKPVITKNIVTPMNPPCNGDGRVWNAMTPRIARARSPSIPLKWQAQTIEMVQVSRLCSQYSKCTLRNR